MSATQADERGVAELVRDLVRAVFAVERGAARMFGAEAREVSRRVGRRLALLVGASIVGAAGALLALAGVAELVEGALRLPRWLALGLVGLTAFGAGAWGVCSALRRLGASDVAFPRTVAEFEKDLAALEGRGRAP